jgi:hypothetical protein
MERMCDKCGEPAGHALQISDPESDPVVVALDAYVAFLCDDCFRKLRDWLDCDDTMVEFTSFV